MTPTSCPESRLARASITVAAVLALALCASLTIAAPAGNRQAPASIEADRVEIDRPGGVSRYFGDVVFEQGTLRITGERMIVRTPDGVLEHAEVHGERAAIRQRTENGEIVHARARHIDYDAAAGVAVLTDEAEVERGDDRFTATRIEYRLDSGRIDASGGDDGGRVHIRIQPREPEGGAENGTPEPGATP
jgi:lipopolysaccharide export system protein LptA